MSDFSIKRADGTEYSVSGYHYAQPNKASAKAFASGLGNRKLPAKVDLRSYMTDVENQKSTSSCVANAVAGAYEYLAKRHLEQSYDVSRLFIYYNARSYKEWEERDCGSFIADAISGLREYGACSEETWEFDPKNVTTEPDEDAYDEASNFLVESSELLPVNLNAWKSALAEGYPIIFGIMLFKSFDSHRKKGLVPMPSQQETTRESHAGHAMLCVGYSDKDQVFIVRNSWGKEWGDNGYCYIPYNYLMNPQLNLGDCWIIKQLDNFDLDEEVWSDDDESVLGDWETELADMSDEDYQEMLEAMGDHPLELRIALILLYGAGADDDLSDEELSEITSYMETLLELLGVEMKTEKLIRNALKHVENEELVYESIELLGEYLSSEMLARIIQDVEELIGVDDLADEENDFLSELVESWQVEDDGDDSEDEEDDEESEDDEEDDEEDDGEDDDEEEDERPSRRR